MIVCGALFAAVGFGVAQPAATRRSINEAGGAKTIGGAMPTAQSAPGGTFTQSCTTPAFPGAATPMDATSCGVDGSGGKEGAQNAAKNNFCATGDPRPVVIQDLIALQQQAASDPTIPFGKNAGRPDGPATDRSPLQALGEGTQVVLTGYVKVARQEGAESVNCDANVPDQPAYHDIHIAIVGTPGDAECNGVVAEMIPHHRPASWTPEILNQVAKSKSQVRLTGDLFFDSSHAPCKNGKPNSGDPSRVSLWEVHPIYKFEVCTQSDCSSGDGWAPLEAWKKP
jgi:hypothetical protein